MPDVSGITNGSSFGVGSEFDIGNFGTDTVEVLLRPLSNTSLVNIHLFADGNSFSSNNVVVPDLGPLGISLPSGEDYSLFLSRYSWPLETMASKLADVQVLNWGASYQEDLTRGTSEPRQLVTD